MVRFSLKRCIMGISNTANVTVSEFLCITTGIDIKDNMKMEKEQAKEFIITLMEIVMKGSFLIQNFKGKGNFIIRMGQYMREIFKTVNL